MKVLQGHELGGRDGPPRRASAAAQGAGVSQ